MTSAYRRRLTTVWGLLASAIAGAAVVFFPPALPVLLVAMGVGFLAARRPEQMAAWLIVGAMPLMRPSLLGENTAAVAFLLCSIAALVAIVQDQGRVVMPAVFVLVFGFLMAASSWLILRTGVAGGQGDTAGFTGLVSTVLVVLAVGVVAGEPARRRTIARGFVFLILASCLSYSITAGLWLVDIPVPTLATFPVNTAGEGFAQLYAPLTTTFGSANVGGDVTTRFTGLGREPGWMACYITVAWFLWPRIGRPRLWGRAVMLLGLFGTVSTAGFAIMVVVGAFEYGIRRAWNTSDIVARMVRLAGGLVAVAAAVAVAANAPVVGLNNKGLTNAISLAERSDATQNGITALTQAPWGGFSNQRLSAVNVVASVASGGIPYAVLILCALLTPLLIKAQGRDLSVVATIFLTLLLAQPPGDSTLVFVLAGLAAAGIPPLAAPQPASISDHPDHPGRPTHHLPGSPPNRGGSPFATSASVS